MSTVLAIIASLGGGEIVARLLSGVLDKAFGKKAAAVVGVVDTVREVAPNAFENLPYAHTHFWETLERKLDERGLKKKDKE